MCPNHWATDLLPREGERERERESTKTEMIKVERARPGSEYSRKIGMQGC
jgi:hypothetical protein